MTGVGFGALVQHARGAFGGVKARKSLEEQGAEAQAMFEKAASCPAMQRDLLEDARKAALAKGAVTQAQLEQVGPALLLQCLRVRRFNVDEGVELLQQMVSFREAQGWPLRLTEADVRDTSDSHVYQILKTNDKHGRAVVTMACGKVDLENHSAKDLHKLAAFTLECATSSPMAQDLGVTLVLDMKGLSLSTIRRTTKADMQRGVDIFSCFPIKVKHVVIVNAGVIFRTAVRTALLALPSSSRKVVTVARSAGDIRELVVDPSLLPPEFA